MPRSGHNYGVQASDEMAAAAAAYRARAFPGDAELGALLEEAARKAADAGHGVGRGPRWVRPGSAQRGAGAVVERARYLAGLGWPDRGVVADRHLLRRADRRFPHRPVRPQAAVTDRYLPVRRPRRAAGVRHRAVAAVRGAAAAGYRRRG